VLSIDVEDWFQVETYGWTIARKRSLPLWRPNGTHA
jgi:hypothetical protein